ncbi:MAG: BTAD domain-containing putative transcriptional regulator [Otoolea sp.]|nr:hypothetical protein [Clostridiaceae bacterium]MDY5483055.1 BTAD domain-containing putative transcriptional regulator [Clostridium sp.]
MDKEKNLCVNMLGGFSITYEQKPVSFGKRSQSRFLQLFQILVLHREGVAKDKLIEAIYDWEELGNKNNCLNNLVYRLRKQLVSAGLPEEDYVRVSKGICTWSGSMPLYLDVWEMEDEYRLAEQTEDREKKIAHFMRAWELYRGELLPQLASEGWVIVESIRLKKLYEEIVRKLGGLLREHREYQKMYRVYSAAAALYPFDEWEICQMDSLMLMERYEEALKLYNDTVKRYSEELGLPPSKRMMESFQRMREKLVKTEDCFTEIMENLEEDTAAFGAYYCAYPSFVDTYRILCRVTERSGQSAFLMSCTLNQLNNSHEKKNSQSVALWLKDAICNSLRRGDICTRYSKNKYLIILMGMHQEDSQIVTGRIKEKFFQKAGTAGYQLEFSLASAVDPGNALAAELLK